MLFELALMRHHKKEKRYGPSPSNNYTSGSRKRFGFGRRKNKTTRDAELATMGGGVAGDKHHNGIRPSHDTGVTGTTMGGTDATYGSNHPSGHVPASTNY